MRVTSPPRPADVMPKRKADALAALDLALGAIELARADEDPDELPDWRDRAAVQLYRRRRDSARDMVDAAGEIKVRAEAALGDRTR